MTTDPAWFYSALAQASAAIVGLVGAILGSRIIDQLQVMRPEQIEIDVAMHDPSSGIRIAAQPTIDRWRAFKEFLIREIAAGKDATERGESTRTFTAELGWNFTKGDQCEEIRITMHQVTLEQDLQLVERLLAAYPPLTGEIKDLSSSVAKLRECVESMPEGHPGLGFALSDLKRFEKLDKTISLFRAKLLPRSFPIVFLILGWIAVAGVVWPLSALPGFPDSFPKPYMLTAFCVGLIGLMGYFGYLLFELKQLGRFYWSER